MLVHDIYKIRYRFFKNKISPCATAADAKSTKLHVAHVQVQILKNESDICVVQTQVDLKNIKWVD